MESSQPTSLKESIVLLSNSEREQLIRDLLDIKPLSEDIKLVPCHTCHRFVIYDPEHITGACEQCNIVLCDRCGGIGYYGAMWDMYINNERACNQGYGRHLCKSCWLIQPPYADYAKIDDDDGDKVEYKLIQIVDE